MIRDVHVVKKKKKKSLTIFFVTVDCGIFVAVRLSCLVFALFIFKFAFHNTHNSGTVYERACSRTSGPHISLCVHLY